MSGDYARHHEAEGLCDLLPPVCSPAILIASNKDRHLDYSPLIIPASNLF